MQGKYTFIIIILLLGNHSMNAQYKSARALGIPFGNHAPGPQNSITDVGNVKVGHTTLVLDSTIRTGATAIIPHDKSIFKHKVPAAIYIGNGYGKLAGISQVEELGNIETPILLTNTLSVGTGLHALITYTSRENPDINIRSVNGVVGETNDGYLNDIMARKLEENDMLQAIDKAIKDKVEEGNVGAGTGTRCFGFKGGIGSSSRILADDHGGYTVGVLVQTNFGGNLTIAGVPIGNILRDHSQDDKDGSCMIVVATDAPLSSRNLKRLAKRAMLGLAKTGGIASNGSGDYVIAFSTFEQNFITETSERNVHTVVELDNSAMTPLFDACIEATEEAIVNSLFAAKDMDGLNGRKIRSLPVDKVIRILKDRQVIE